MSLLDAVRQHQQNEKQVGEILNPIFEAFFDSDDAKKYPALQDLKEGHSLKDILGISDGEMRALNAAGVAMLQNGEHEKAKEVFVQLLTWDPYNEDYIYCLASTHHIAGDLQTAVKLYIQFVAFDATNPTGYLRLGECMMANGEKDYAGTFFRIAKKECERGNGSSEQQAYARQMLALLEVAEQDPQNQEQGK